jgi:enamine deaminase RidA (YjgF/YER057c/UK114 family)
MKRSKRRKNHDSKGDNKMSLMSMINPSNLPKPSGFSYAVRSEGDLSIYISGQTALDREGAIVGAGDILLQFKQVLKNMQITLSAAGAEMVNIVKLTLFVTDVEGYKNRAKEIGSVYQRYFVNHYPAMTLVEVERLWDEEALIEIEGVAII